MRHRRLKAPASFPVAYYHCLSRVVDRQFVFGELEREPFLKYLREYETFCGVRVLTYCLLSNHFHLLLEVPAKPAAPLTADELIAKLEGLSSTALTAATARQRIALFRQANDPAGEREFIDRLCATMNTKCQAIYRFRGTGRDAGLRTPEPCAPRPSRPTNCALVNNSPQPIVVLALPIPGDGH